MTNIKRVYLAGPIAGLTYDEAALSWRSDVREMLAGRYEDTGNVTNYIQCYSPMRGKDFLRDDLGPDKRFDMQSYPQSPISTTNGILGRDRNDVAKADLVFMNVLGAKAVSIGTTVEMGWADAYRVPVVLCMEDGNPHDHLFYKGLATYHVKTLEEGVTCAKYLLLPRMV